MKAAVRACDRSAVSKKLLLNVTMHQNAVILLASKNRHTNLSYHALIIMVVRFASRSPVAIAHAPNNRSRRVLCHECLFCMIGRYGPASPINGRAGPRVRIWAPMSQYCSFRRTRSVPGQSCTSTNMTKYSSSARGCALFTVGDRQITAEAGQILMAPAHVPHKFVNLGPGRLETTDIHLSDHFAQVDLE